MFLLSDAGQMAAWPKVKTNLKEGDALYFSHGFSIVYKEQTGVIPPKNVDVIMVAPKGSGRSRAPQLPVRERHQLQLRRLPGRHGRAEERPLAARHRHRLRLPVPDHLRAGGLQRPDRRARRAHGRLAGVMEAQYDVLRKHGHTPSEAFNETVEELTQSLIRLVDENGMDWMYSNCSTTAQRGALDWKPKFRNAVAPVFASSTRRQAGQGDGNRPEGQQRPGLPGEAGQGARRDEEFRNVESRHSGEIPQTGEQKKVRRRYTAHGTRSAREGTKGPDMGQGAGTPASESQVQKGKVTCRGLIRLLSFQEMEPDRKLLRKGSRR